MPFTPPPKKGDISECVDKAIFINTYLRMLNRLLSEKIIHPLYRE